MNPQSRDDITAEKSLFAIWSDSQKVRKPIFNRCVRYCGLIALIVYAAMPWTSTDSLIGSSRTLTMIGLPALLGLLGFLLAGYTVFVSIARRDLLVAMSSVVERHSQLSWLKVSMYTFVGALIEILVVASVLFVMLVLGQPGGLVATLAARDPSGHARDIIAWVSFVTAGYAFIHTLMALKVTIRNVHHGIAAAIRWDAENPEKRCSGCNGSHTHNSGM